MKTAILLLVLVLWRPNAEAAVSALETNISSETRIWASAFSLATIDAQSAQDGGASMFTYNYVSLNMAGQGRTHWSLRIPFIYQTAGFDDFNGDVNQNQQIKLDDLLVDYSNSELLLPGDIEVFSRYRIELPTGEGSRRQKNITSLRIDYIASKNLSQGFELEYWPQIRWNIHTQTVYENPDTGMLTNTKRYELDQRLSLWYKANPRLNIGFYVGAEDTWFNKSKVNETTRTASDRFAEHLLKVGPSVRWKLNKHLTFLFNVQNGVPLWGYSKARTGELNDLGTFKPEHTEFVLLSFINF